MNKSDILTTVTNKIKQIKNHKTFHKRILQISIIILILMGFAYILGYRFTSDQAVKASDKVNKDSIFMGKENFGSFRVYLYENPDKYYTVIADYGFPFWRAGTSFWANKTDDKVKLVGWCSYGDKKKSITVVPVKCYDKNVAYIEMGPDIDRIHKDITSGQTIIFSWERALPWNNLNGIAYSKNNKALYKLGYEIKNSTINISELRWLPAESTDDNNNNQE